MLFGLSNKMLRVGKMLHFLKHGRTGMKRKNTENKETPCSSVEFRVIHVSEFPKMGGGLIF
jgi:hypothetical protein